MALAAAAYDGVADAIPMLIRLGADPNACNRGLNPYATPLHNAVCSGSLETVKALLESGAEAGSKDNAYQATPADWADYFVRSKRRSTGQDAGIAAYLHARETGR